MDEIRSYLTGPLLNATGALLALLDIMVLPAVLMIVGGGILWRKGWLMNAEDKTHLGKMLFMFGCILLVIVLLMTYFLEQIAAQKQGAIL